VGKHLKTAFLTISMLLSWVTFAQPSAPTNWDIFISGGADTSRNGFVGFLPDAIALTGVTTAGKMESQLKKGELR
jgi:hypothetical protein